MVFHGFLYCFMEKITDVPCPETNFFSSSLFSFIYFLPFLFMPPFSTIFDPRQCRTMELFQTSPTFHLFPLPTLLQYICCTGQPQQPAPLAPSARSFRKGLGLEKLGVVLLSKRESHQDQEVRNTSEHGNPSSPTNPTQPTQPPNQPIQPIQPTNLT